MKSTRTGKGPQDPAAGGRGVLTELAHGEARLIYLARRRESLPDGTAPILAIEPGGVIRLCTPPPLAATPGPAVWPRLGILLPRERLSALLPAERASLLRIWTTVSRGGGVSPGQIVARDLDYRPEEVATLLRWQR